MRSEELADLRPKQRKNLVRRRPEHRTLHSLSIPHHPPLSSVDKVVDSQQQRAPGCIYGAMHHVDFSLSIFNPAAVATFLALQRMKSGVGVSSPADLIINSGTCGGFKRKGASIM